MIFTETESVLLSLIAVGIGNKESVSLPDRIDWKGLFALSERQGVNAIVSDGVRGLSNNQTISSFVDSTLTIPKFQWLGKIMKMEQRYLDYERTIGEISDFIEKQQVNVLLMKGYGCSLNYPYPNHRPCGDIDIYCGSNFGIVNQMVEQRLGVKINYENDHHATFHYKGWLVENHKTILDVDKHPSNISLENLLEEDAFLNCQSIQLDNVNSLIVPSVAFNSIHLLRHMASDFATVKTTLRHVLDWATFIKANNNIDWIYIRDIARKSNMNRFLDAINAICVDFLGYPADLFPIENRNVKLEQMVLLDILRNTDQVDAPQRNLSFFMKINYGLTKTRRMWKNRWKYKIVYDESFWQSFWGLATNRLKH